MTQKFVRFLGLLIILNLFRNVLSIKKGYYTIVTPGRILPDSTFHVSFTLNDFHKSCWFNLSIKSFTKEDAIYEFNGIEVKPRTTKLVELHSPHFNSSRGILKILAYQGIIAEESEHINFWADQYWAFVQTNKPKYKPGELVKFRIICIDDLKRPAKLKDDKIFVQIYDDQGNLIKTILNIKFVKGVFRSEFQLSDFPVLGKWKISVLTDDYILANRNFEVDRYELQKFAVQVNTRDVYIYDKQIEINITASYFYDEPVKGNLSLIVTCLYGPYSQEIQDLTRKIPINGNTTIVLDLKNDLHIIPETQSRRNIYPFTFRSWSSTSIYKFHITAVVIDERSEEESWSTAEFKVFDQPYHIKLVASSVFKSLPVINLKAQIFIMDSHDNPIEVFKSPIEVIVGCAGLLNEKNYEKYDVVRIDVTNAIENNFLNVNVTNKNYTSCYMYAEYERSKSENKYLNRSPMEVELITKSPEEGKKLEIQITSQDPIDEFSYEIVSRRDIIQSGHVEVPGNVTKYILQLDVTFAMVPRITVYVHHIKGMGFRGHLKDVPIKRAHLNTIEIETDKEAQPGSPINITIKTDQGSYVGLMGLDRRALKNINKNEIFDADNVDNKLRVVNGIRSYKAVLDYGGRVGDVITFSNAFFKVKFDAAAGGGQFEKPARNHFPESWLFLDFEMTPEGGIHFMDTTPDTITTWAITSFSIHPDTGLTFTKNATNLRVFQEFFISMDLPSSIREGEIVEIPVYMSNYMDEGVVIDTTIESDSSNLQIMDHLETNSSLSMNKISKRISVKDKEKLVFFAKPLKTGAYNVTVRATSSKATDAIQKTLHVQPEGIPFAMSKTYLVNLPEEGLQENEISIDIPENDVHGSERVDVSVVGDIFRPLMKNLQNQAQVPYGNGQENIRLIICNAIVLKYLKILNHSNPILENKLKFHLELGYQNQLSYKYLDGSFGLFERKTERTGDIWQTIFALFGLQQASEFVDVEPIVIKRGLGYLRSKQQHDGCFKSEKGLEEDVKITAFGLWVFLMNKKLSEEYVTTDDIDDYLECLYDLSDDLEYSPNSMMAAFVLMLGNHHEAEDYLRGLITNPPLKNRKVLLTKSDTLESHLEATVETLINIFENRLETEQIFLHIVKGLLSQEDEESSIIQMVALQIMTVLLEKLSLGDENLRIVIKDDHDKSSNFRVNTENSQVLQRFQVSDNSHKINIQCKGHGFAVVDVSYSYNLVPVNVSSSNFSMRVSNKKTSRYLSVLKVCINSHEKGNSSKLTVMEINLQSGFIFEKRDYETAENSSVNIKLQQINDGNYKSVLYFELENNGTCIEFDIRNNYKVFNSKPGWIIVYDAENKDQKTIESFIVNGFELNDDFK